MPRIKDALTAARKMISGETPAEAFDRRRRESLQQWRRLVAKSAAGESVDIDEIALAATYLGVAPAKVSDTFTADVACWNEQQQLAEHAAKLEAHANEARATSMAADEQLVAAREHLARLEQESKAGVWASVGAAHGEAAALTHRRSNSRLFDDARELNRVEADAQMMVPDDEPAVERTPVAAVAGDDDGAFWDTSSGD